MQAQATEFFPASQKILLLVDILRQADERQQARCYFMRIERPVRKALGCRLLFGEPKNGALAYQLLTCRLASFGGGPNVNSRDGATKGG
jgi:hypothetical protein